MDAMSNLAAEIASRNAAATMRLCYGWDDTGLLSFVPRRYDLSASPVRQDRLTRGEHRMMNRICTTGTQPLDRIPFLLEEAL
jgi:hypothetical protein